jgi:uncharacterized membrane protein YhaH (DUF805 family)
MQFMPAVKRVFSNYANFSGRATRPEYWWFCLFNLIVGVVLGVLGSLADIGYRGGNALQDLYSLAVLVPSLAVATRRLHDTDKSGWRQLWALTIVGIIPLIFWLAQPTQAGANKYGPQPVVDVDVPPAA